MIKIFHFFFLLNQEQQVNEIPEGFRPVKFFLKYKKIPVVIYLFSLFLKKKKIWIYMYCSIIMLMSRWTLLFLLNIDVS